MNQTKPRTTSIGKQAEALVVVQLQTKGFTILEQNWRMRYSEIDLVVQRGSSIFFIEVKYRKNADFGGGQAAITADKQQRLRRAVVSWLKANRAYANFQPQLLIIVVEGSLVQPQYRHYLLTWWVVFAIIQLSEVGQCRPFLNLI